MSAKDRRNPWSVHPGLAEKPPDGLSLALAVLDDPAWPPRHAWSALSKIGWHFSATDGTRWSSGIFRHGRWDFGVDGNWNI